MKDIFTFWELQNVISTYINYAYKLGKGFSLSKQADVIRCTLLKAKGVQPEADT